jgi:cation diffusion facilitator family transporter
MSHGNEGAVKAILYAFLANLGIALSKLAAALYTGSTSMLAESIHSAADCVNQVLLYAGIRRSRRAPDQRHPLGYGKAVYFWSFMVAILLFSMGGMFSIYEGIHKILEPEPLKDVHIAIGVIAFSILLETGSLLGALREIKKIRGGTPLLQWLLQSRKAELIVVFGEDIAALVGLIFAGLFLFLAAITANPVFDAFGSAAIGILLVTVSIFLSIRIKSMLVGESADPEIEQTIQRQIRADASIDKLLRIITAQLGPDILLACKVKMKPNLTLNDAIAAINQLEKSIKATLPDVRWSFIEIDIED